MLLRWHDILPDDDSRPLTSRFHIIIMLLFLATPFPLYTLARPRQYLRFLLILLLISPLSILRQMT